ncbi:MAG TPA: sulfurtransferase, partial [Actinomycetota bacterium]|nr:sulfurtransferase [Actinomycetota bacterium]
MGGYAKPQVLVDLDWVEKHVSDDAVAIVEVDEDTGAYASGHIPGAIAWNWKTDLQDPVRRDFVSAEDFAKLLGESGIDNDTTIVLYGGNNNWFAAYAYWYLRYYGHGDVRLMDGGRKKWELENRSLTTDVTSRPNRTYRPGTPDSSIRALRDQVKEAIGSQNIVDVRSPDEYSGKLLAPAHLPNEAAQRPGHVPTAKNIPWSKTVQDEDGTFRDAEELLTLYRSEGVDTSKDTIAYCRIGERSAHTWFVLHELLGVPNVRNYDGSWTEWGSLVGAPIERSHPPRP